MKIDTFTGIVHRHAQCLDCGWTNQQKNALPTAKLHAMRYGHEVSVEQTLSVTYKPAQRDES